MQVFAMHHTSACKDSFPVEKPLPRANHSLDRKVPCEVAEVPERRPGSLEGLLLLQRTLLDSSSRDLRLPLAPMAPVYTWYTQTHTGTHIKKQHVHKLNIYI